jgi:hypothetical protein
MAKLSDARTKIKGLVRDGAKILADPSDFDDALSRALEIYSKDRPRTSVTDLSSDGTGNFDTAQLTGFDPNFSGDVLIEYPIGVIDGPSYLDRRDWHYYQSPTAYLIVVTDKPGTGSNNVRFSWKVQHQIPVDNTGANDPNGALSVPISDLNAVCKLAAAEACQALANFYSQSAADLADMANYQNKGRDYETRAKTLRSQYAEHVGKKEDQGAPGATAVVNWDQGDSRGLDRIHHQKRFR